MNKRRAIGIQTDGSTATTTTDLLSIQAAVA